MRYEQEAQAADVAFGSDMAAAKALITLRPLLNAGMSHVVLSMSVPALKSYNQVRMQAWQSSSM